MPTSTKLVQTRHIFLLKKETNGAMKGRLKKTLKKKQTNKKKPLPKKNKKQHNNNNNNAQDQENLLGPNNELERMQGYTRQNTCYMY